MNKTTRHTARISIAMTTYNGASYLHEQLDSIYSQTMLPDQVCVCDDGSTDDTVNILEQYHQQYGLQYIVNTHSLGINANFMQAISKCTGDYICLCDQDDVWLEDKIERTFRAMQSMENGATLITTSAQDVDESLHPLKKALRRGNSRYLGHVILLDECAQGCTMMLNRSLADQVLSLKTQYPELLQATMYDAMLSLVAASTGTFHAIPDRTMLYRRHQHNAVGHIAAHYTIAQRFALHPLYNHFWPADRLSALHTLYPILQNKMSPMAQSIIQHAFKIEAAKNVWIGLARIWQIPEFSKVRCLEITFYTLLDQLGKKIFVR